QSIKLVPPPSDQSWIATFFASLMLSMRNWCRVVLTSTTARCPQLEGKCCASFLLCLKVFSSVDVLAQIEGMTYSWIKDLVAGSDLILMCIDRSCSENVEYNDHTKSQRLLENVKKKSIRCNLASSLRQFGGSRLLLSLMSSVSCSLECDE